jgi:hypothetical protein
MDRKGTRVAGRKNFAHAHSPARNVKGLERERRGGGRKKKERRGVEWEEKNKKKHKIKIYQKCEKFKFLYRRRLQTRLHQKLWGCLPRHLLSPSLLHHTKGHHASQHNFLSPELACLVHGRLKHH